MLGILADDAAHHRPLAVAAKNKAAVFTDRFAGSTDFHEEDGEEDGTATPWGTGGVEGKRYTMRPLLRS